VKQYLIMALVAAAVVYASNKVTAVKNIIGS